MSRLNFKIVEQSEESIAIVFWLHTKYEQRIYSQKFVTMVSKRSRYGEKPWEAFVVYRLTEMLRDMERYIKAGYILDEDSIYSEKRIPITEGTWTTEERYATR